MGRIFAESCSDAMFTVALLYASSSNYAAKMSPESFQTNIVTFLSEVQRATADPFKFSSFHTAIRQPFDYYKWYVCVCSPLLLSHVIHLLLLLLLL